MSGFKKKPTLPPPIPTGSTIILDLGTSTTRGGVHGEELPRINFPTVTARPRNGKRPVYIGDDAINARGNFGFFYPIEKGLIKDWKEVEQIFFHTFYNLKIASREHPILITESVDTPKEYKEKLTSFLFEEFNIPYLKIVNSAILALGEGKTGIVIESGHFRTQIIPIVEGKIVNSNITTWGWGGLDLTNYFAKLTGKSDFPGAVKDLKEKFCYIASNYTEEKKTIKSKPPSKDVDGKVQQLGVEHIQVGEAFFQPDFIDQKHDPLPLCVLNTILKCESKIQQNLLENIILSGGNTMFPNFDIRLVSELKTLLSTSKFSSLASLNVTPTVNAIPNRVHAAWIGGTAIKTDDTAHGLHWVSRAEYDSSGSSVIHRKCP